MRRAGCVIGALLAVLWSVPLGAQQATGTVRGRVTDATTQQALVGASVSLGTRRVLSQVDGRYVVTGVPAGTDSLRVFGSNDAVGQDHFTVAALRITNVSASSSDRIASRASLGLGSQGGAMSCASSTRFFGFRVPRIRGIGAGSGRP